MTTFLPSRIQPRRILVITLRFLGDTLLTTALIRSLKLAYPDAAVDVLAFRNAAAMLEGNPDIAQVISLPGKPRFAEFAGLLLKLWRRYDLAVSTQTGDRPTLCAFAAGKFRIGPVPDKPQTGWRKRYLLHGWLVFDPGRHTVLENLRLCELLTIPRHYRLVPPRTTALLQQPATPYTVLHIAPQWRYKQWHRDGWLQLAAWLRARGYRIVLSGSTQPDEQRLLNELLPALPADTLNLSGQLSLAQLTALLGNAVLFVGPDTGITHLAAATGVKTAALFGPTDPRIWAPWPIDYCDSAEPFTAQGTQRVGNVLLIQGTANKDCIPCQQEGCERRRTSHSDCLDNLDAATVITAIAALLDR